MKIPCLKNKINLTIIPSGSSGGSANQTKLITYKASTAINRKVTPTNFLVFGLFENSSFISIIEVNKHGYNK